ncbi:MAG: spermidine/putrescine ABC transporter substrate-binding protein, partial [Kineosporiaceae bacterium]
MPTGVRVAVLAAAAVTALAGCGSGSSGGTSSAGGGSGTNRAAPPSIPVQQSVGAGEGEVDLVSWAGYVMDGSKAGDPDWVTPFEKQ